jgi:hypothetical protein
MLTSNANQERDMTEFTGTILCGVCRGDLTGPSDFDNATVFKCSGCGQTEQYGKIVEEAQAYFTDVVAGRFDDQLAGIAKGNKFITVTPFDRPKRTYRYILDNIPNG